MRRMTTRFALLLPFALAACSASGQQPPATSQATSQAQCEQQALDDPTVHDLTAKIAGANNTAPFEWQRQLDEAKHQATMRCLRARGLAPAGGVERQR